MSREVPELFFINLTDTDSDTAIWVSVHMILTIEEADYGSYLRLNRGAQLCVSESCSEILDRISKALAMHQGTV